VVRAGGGVSACAVDAGMELQRPLNASPLIVVGSISNQRAESATGQGGIRMSSTSRADRRQWFKQATARMAMRGRSACSAGRNGPSGGTLEPSSWDARAQAKLGGLSAA
jgi:hypothetical protein